MSLWLSCNNLLLAENCYVLTEQRLALTTACENRTSYKEKTKDAFISELILTMQANAISKTLVAVL